MRQRIAAGATVFLFAHTLLAAPPPIDRVALQAQVRAEFLYSWKAYEKYAWGHDELRPLSKQPRDWYGESLLMTPVDSLDTLLLMGFNEEADKAQTLIVDHLSFDKDISVKVFEITIRELGGLLSAYEMTGDARLLHLADDLARACFRRSTRPPVCRTCMSICARGRRAARDRIPPRSER